jgi:hypothetical protein
MQDVLRDVKKVGDVLGLSKEAEQKVRLAKGGGGARR